MNRNIFSVALCVLLLALSIPAEAQQSGKKIPRMGYLSTLDPASESARSEAIRLVLRELGYIEGQNIAIEYRYAGGKLDQLPKLASELVRLKVDVIVTVGVFSVVRAAKNATKTIPIVMVGPAIDAVEAGLVESLAHPGGKVTGVTSLSVQLGARRLELLREAVTKVAHVVVLYDPANTPSVIEVKEVLPGAARALGVAVRSWEVRATDGFERVFAALKKERPDGLYVPVVGPLMRSNIKRIADFALKSRLPSVYPNKYFVDAGGSCPTAGTARTATGAPPPM